MFKRIIAGILSTTVICSSVFTGVLDSKISMNKNVPDIKVGEKNEELNVSAKNSLGKYINNSSEKSNINPEVSLLSNKAESSFNITDLEFEAESGKLKGVSSQTNDCTIVFSFIDEENNNIVQEVKTNVKSGELVVTEAKADISNLPKYYIVQAQLIDKNGSPVSNTFKLNTYTQIMQEIAATDIHDFNEEQVVNFDESEDTNFIVLSEDTVKAESSENENTLVSADYENDTFVFENINESIQYLQSGDFLYVQPDVDNIIAVAVEKVDIEGDTATVTGSDDIDDMLTFVKLETEGTMEGAEIDTSESDEGVVFPGHEGEEKFTVDDDKPIDLMYNSRKPISVKLEPEFNVDLNVDPTKSTDPIVDDPTVKIGVSFSVKFSINFCKKWGYTSLAFSITPEINASLKIESSGDFDLEGINPFKRTVESAKEGLKNIGEYLQSDGRQHFVNFFKIIVPTQAFVNLEIDVSLTLELTGMIEVGIKYSATRGYKYDTKNGGQKIYDPDENGWSFPELNIEGKAFIGFIVEPALTVMSNKIASVGFKLTVGVEVTVTPHFGYRITDILHSNPEDFYKVSEDKKVVVMDSDDEYIHTCDLCFDGSVCFKIDLGLAVKILGKNITQGVDLPIEIPLPFLDFYFGYPNFSWGIDEDPDTYEHGVRSLISDYLGGIEFGRRGNYTGDPEEKTCPHYKFKMPFKIVFENGEPVNGAVIRIDSLENRTNNYGQAHFYCDKKTSYSYSVSYGSDIVKGGMFYTDQWTLRDGIKIVLKAETDDAGNIKIVDAEEEKNDLPTETTIVTQTEPQTQTKIYTTKALEVKDEDLVIESEKLGDNVWGIIYPDGGMYIYGYGDMYSDGYKVIKNLNSVKTVVFDDLDPENGEYITSISDSLFREAENLETVYLSNEITKIGSKAFENCKKLKYFRYGGENDKTETLVLPSKLETIGSCAFSGCSSAAFGDLEFGNNLKTLSWDAFRSCSGIKNVKIPSCVTTISPTVFAGCDQIETAVLEANPETVGTGLFDGCTSLEELVLPDFITINSDAIYGAKGGLEYLFHNNSSIQWDNIHVPKSLKKVSIMGGTVVPVKMMHRLEGIETLALPTGITSIGNEAFSSCNFNIVCSDEKKDITFNDLLSDVVSIGDSAFLNCKNISMGDLHFGDKLERIGSSAFKGCTTITNLYLPSSIKPGGYGYESFYGCTSLEKVKIDADVPDDIIGSSKSLGLGQGMFYGCSSITELILPYCMKVNHYLTDGSDPLFKHENLLICAFNDASDRWTNPAVIDNLKKITIMGGTQIPANYFWEFYNVETLVLPAEFNFADTRGTHDMRDSCKEVIYKGTEEEWNAIVESGNIKEQNEPLSGVITFSPDEAEEWKTGDANGDGEIDMSDIVLIMQALANPNKYGINGTDPTHITENGFKYGDINGDGLTVNDAVRIQEYLLGKISTLA